VIKYEWRTRLDDGEAAQLADLLDRAAAYDAEPEYSTISYKDVARAMADSHSAARHLIIWMLPYARALSEPLQPERIAGVLRLQLDADGGAEATIVIDPELRSRGIVTLLLEQTGLDTARAGGWMDTGAQTVSAWARGNHPAAGRLGDRFLIARTRRIWKLIRASASPQEIAEAAVLERVDDDSISALAWAGATATDSETLVLREGAKISGLLHLDRRPVMSEEFGSCATITRVAFNPAADDSARHRLLQAAVALAGEAGFTGLTIHVDSADSALVHVCRLAGFQHDRTDVRFQLGETR
jgi:mycothiol synthase